MARQGGKRAVVGFTVKSGWAALVSLHGPADSPRVASSLRVELSDPAEPDQRQPYHAGFGTARAADGGLERLLRSTRQYGAQSVRAGLQRCRAAGYAIELAGAVVGSTGDPGAIANDHIRIHALEGKLFREVVADAAAACGIACTIWRERDLYTAATRALGRSEQDLKAALTDLRKTVSGGWRSEQKSAALAAWILLAAVGGDPDLAGRARLVKRR